jgi:hypothetical protein
MHILSPDGHYWIGEPDGDLTGINFLAGFVFKIGSSWIVQIGGEVEPMGITLGTGFRI